MIVRKDNTIPEVRERLREGPGEIVLQNPLKKDQYPPHCRLYTTMVLKRGCGIGTHVHSNECEIYYILQGEGVYIDNGSEYILKQGDVSITYSGEAHSIRNENYEDLLVLATIITE